MGKQILVADLDQLSAKYKVVDESGRVIGEKSRTFGLLKPEYARDGRRFGGRFCDISDRTYHSTPPWFKCEVFWIDELYGDLVFHVRKGGSTSGGQEKSDRSN